MEKRKEEFPLKTILIAIGVLYLSIIPIHYYLKIGLFVLIGILVAKYYLNNANENESNGVKSRTAKINEGVIALLTIFITINLTSDYEKLKETESREIKIKYQLTALMTNTAVNLRKIRDLREGFKFEEVKGKPIRRISETRLDSEYSYQLLRDPDLYEFCGYGLITAINVMAESIDNVNYNSEYARSNYNLESYNLVKDSSLLAKYRVMVVQYALDYYLNKYSTYFNKESNLKELQALNHVKGVEDMGLLNKYIMNLQERINDFGSHKNNRKPIFELYKPYNQR